MKNIVICCDGTRGEFGSKDKNTNVVRLFGRLRDCEDQLLYYDPGVGTHNARRTALGQWLRNSVASMFGNGLITNVLQAYRYLMTHYEPGDRIYLFGYSRGAHSVRVLAGMLYKCGLLTQGSENLIPYMARVYRRKHNDPIAEDFKHHFAHRPKVHLIGVWDTVASMGFLWRKYYRNRRLNPEVTHAYQALSVDERRLQFQPSIWDVSGGLPEEQSIEQVWFSGRHVDVGGQEVPGRGISDITLLWMMEKAIAAKLVPLPDWRAGLTPDPRGPLKRSWTTSLWGRVLGKQRVILADASVHQSVLDRIGDPSCDYRPANLSSGEQDG